MNKLVIFSMPPAGFSWMQIVYWSSLSGFLFYSSNSSCGLRATLRTWLFLICGQRRSNPVSVYIVMSCKWCISIEAADFDLNMDVCILCIHDLISSNPFCSFLFSHHWPGSSPAAADSGLPPRPSARHVAHFRLKGAWRELHEHHRAASWPG